MDQREQASRRPDSVGKTYLRTFMPSLVLLLVALASLCALLIADPGVSYAVVMTNITSDGTLGTTLNGGVICASNCTITGGTRPGGGPNLFHSFGQFNLGTGDTANFQNSFIMINGTLVPIPTTNILSRVTGGNPSNIYGTIQTTDFGNANLFLINPAGVVFGPSATLNVGGSFHVSTADYIRLTDGAQFNAIPGPQDALLSTAPVSAFGFLSPNPAAIAIQGSNLSVQTGQTLSVVGGEITIQGGTLSAPSGRIQIASVGAPAGDSGEVIIRSPDGTPDFQLAGFAGSGQIQLVNDPAPVLDGGNILKV